MKQLFKSSFFLSLVIFSSFFTETTTAQKLEKPLEEYLGMYALPLEVGNVWNYRNGYLQPDIKLSIIDTLMIDGNKYYLEKYQYPSGYSDAWLYLRLREDGYYGCRILDTNLARFPNEDYLYYKKDANVGDIWSQEEVRGKLWYHIVLDTIQVSSFWGSFLPVKIVEITDSSLTTYLEYWSEEFGLVKQQNTDWFSGGWSLLWGCYINGQQYGDTVLVSVDDENPGEPGDFKLYQNYPNPFNSSTIINYEIANSSFVSIVVYDVLGKEVTTLVNENKPAGIYEVEFNASQLPSGMYIYKIRSGNFVETKKMLLMK
jgi:hypothetical protein